MRRRAPWAVLGLILCTSVSALAQVSSSSSRKSTPKAKAARPTSEQLERDLSFDVLEEAYSTSRDLSSESRIPLLAEICQQALMINLRSREPFVTRKSGAGTVKTAPSAELKKKQKDKLKDWAEELYALGNEFPDDSVERNTAVVSATRSLIETDLDRALEIFASSETQDGEVLASRAGIDVQLFQALYRSKGTAALPELRTKAVELGDHGRYPFEAVNAILRQVEGHPELVRKFFSDALAYYRQSDMPIQRSFAFMGLIGAKEIRDQLEPWQIRDAAQELADKATAYVRTQEQLRSSGLRTDPGCPVVVNTVRNSVKLFAPEIADAIPDPPSFVPSAHREPQSTTRPKAPVPDDALKLLHDAFEKNRTRIMVMNEDDIHDGPEMRETIDRAISLGSDYVLRTVRSYEPQDRRYGMQATIDPLIDTVQVGTRVNPAATLAAIRRIQDSDLRTRLLITVAGSIQYMH